MLNRLVAGLAPVLFWTGSAIAQPVLEEIVVTAQKRPESLQDVPVAVTALNGEQLENFGVTDTQSL